MADDVARAIIVAVAAIIAAAVAAAPFVEASLAADDEVDDSHRELMLCESDNNVGLLEKSKPPGLIAELLLKLLVRLRQHSRQRVRRSIGEGAGAAAVGLLAATRGTLFLILVLLFLVFPTFCGRSVG